MKKISALLLLLNMVLMLACKKQAADDGHSLPDWKEETVMVYLDKCETATFGKEQVSLCLNTVADSRCPVNANCIWGGTAITEVTFSKNGQQHRFHLAIPAFASYPQEQAVAGYTIKLINVYPYPEAGVSFPAGQVKAKLEIRNY